MRRRILSFGHNSTLLRLRNAVIQSAGHEVITTKETTLVLELARKQDFDAVVICNSIPVVLREAIARQLKRLKPEIPLIILCEEEECNRFKTLAEIVIAPPAFSQDPLLHAITRVTNKTKDQQRRIKAH